MATRPQAPPRASRAAEQAPAHARRRRPLQQQRRAARAVRAAGAGARLPARLTMGRAAAPASLAGAAAGARPAQPARSSSSSDARARPQGAAVNCRVCVCMVRKKAFVAWGASASCTHPSTVQHAFAACAGSTRWHRSSVAPCKAKPNPDPQVLPTACVDGMRAACLHTCVSLLHRAHGSRATSAPRVSCGPTTKAAACLHTRDPFVMPLAPSKAHHRCSANTQTRPLQRNCSTIASVPQHTAYMVGCGA